MTRPPLWIPPGGTTLVEVSNRTIQGRYLLRPTAEVRDMILGVVGRAQRIYGMKICLLVFMNNHYHMLLQPTDAQQLARFMNWVGGELGRKISRHTGWDAPVWAGRYRPIIVSEEASAQLARFRYLASHGVKEGLVEGPEDWAGVHGLKAWLHGEPLIGHWHDQTRESAARRRGEKVCREHFLVEERVTLSPLPCWVEQGSSLAEIRREIQNLVDEITAWGRAELPLERRATKDTASNGTATSGARQRPRPGRSKADREPRSGRLREVLSLPPEYRPPKLDRGPCPLFHASSTKGFTRLREAFGAFLGSYRVASAALRGGQRDVRFPTGSFPPAGPFVGAVA